MTASTPNKSAPKLRRSWGQRALLAINLVSILAALTTALTLRLSYVRAASIQRVQLGGILSDKADVADGSQVFNLLLVGYDSAAGLDPDDPIQVGRQGERFSDVIVIARIDEVSETVTLLSVPRDLWLPIAGLDRSQKINYAFAAGGPAVLIDTIERELGVPIHHYASVDFAGFQGLVEVVGSVDVYFERPARDWNAHPASGEPRSQTGFEMLNAGCRSLDPPEALAYVRSRYYQVQGDDGTWVDSDPPSDLGRIERQQDFLRRLLAEVIDAGARNPFVLAEMIDASLDHVTIDQELTAELLLDVGRSFRQLEAEQVQAFRLPTTFGWEGTASVLHIVDSEAEPLLELMRGASYDDPKTVVLTVVADSEVATEGELVVADLQAAGFAVAGASPGETADGLVIRHGSSGAQAAELVNSALGGVATLEEIDTLLGRAVIVTVGPRRSTSSTESSPTSEFGSPQSGATVKSNQESDLAATVDGCP